MRTPFQRLRAKRDYFNKKLLHEGYLLANGNISALARGFGVTRPTLYKWLREAFGTDYETKLKEFTIKKSMVMPYIGEKSLTR